MAKGFCDQPLDPWLLARRAPWNGSKSSNRSTQSQAGTLAGLERAWICGWTGALDLVILSSDASVRLPRSFDKEPCQPTKDWTRVMSHDQQETNATVDMRKNLHEAFQMLKAGQPAYDLHTTHEETGHSIGGLAHAGFVLCWIKGHVILTCACQLAVG